MATSTFGKQFVLRPDQANEFVREMMKQTETYFMDNFHSYLTKEQDIREDLAKALGKNERI